MTSQNDMEPKAIKRRNKNEKIPSKTTKENKEFKKLKEKKTPSS